MSELKQLLGKQILFFDGGTGSVLQSWGLKPGELLELWNVAKPEKIIQLHKNYFDSGTNIIKTNTFGAYSLKFPDSEGETSQIVSSGVNVRFPTLKNVIYSAVENAKKARELNGEKNKFIALDLGPCGKLLKPMGDLDFEEAVSIFKTSILYGLEKGVDAILIETMNDSYETKACVVAAKEAKEILGLSEIPVFVTNVYDEKSSLLTGANPETMTAILEGLGVDALGLNCSLGPEQMIGVVERLINSSSIPVIVNPNAGLPREENGKTVYDVSPSVFAEKMLEIAKMGAAVLGGCCGTTPEFIKETVCAVKKASTSSDSKIPLFKEINQKNKTVISSYTHTVELSSEKVPVLIGERINPTGKKKFKEALRSSDIPYIIHQALEQEEAGCHVLDVNVGLPEINEEEMMVKVITELQAVTNLPLQIDSSSPEVIEKALRRYNGKALVNSVNGKQHIMDAIFPIVKKYGGVVVALTLDENGIPETSEERIKIAEKIYENALKWGISKKDIVVDALTMSISSDTNAAKATLETVKTITDKFGGNTILGVSNISFGLPNREIVTSSFFTLAMQAGLSSAIMNPLSDEMMKAYYSFCLLTGKDKDCLNYIDFASRYSEKKEKEKILLSSEGVKTEIKNSASDLNSSDSQLSPLSNSIIHGLKEDSGKLTSNLLKSVEAVEIIDSHIIPGLDFVGQKFEQKKMYLPQLLMAAEAAKSAFSEIKSYLEKNGKKGEPKGTVIIATVHGDIHDIGKNIVKVLLENYDFNVIDLGKDVPPEKVVDSAVKNNVKLVGLSALMTTTVPAMKETIDLLRKASPSVKICVGGAVMTQEYADKIGADFYGKDAMATVNYAQKVFEVASK